MRKSTVNNVPQISIQNVEFLRNFHGNILLIGGSRHGKYSDIANIIQQISKPHIEKVEKFEKIGRRERGCHIFAPELICTSMANDPMIKDTAMDLKYHFSYTIDLHIYDVKAINAIFQSVDIEIVIIGGDVGVDYDSHRAMLIMIASINKPVFLMSSALLLESTLLKLRRFSSIYCLSL